MPKGGASPQKLPLGVVRRGLRSSRGCLLFSPVLWAVGLGRRPRQRVEIHSSGKINFFLFLMAIYYFFGFSRHGYCFSEDKSCDGYANHLSGSSRRASHGGCLYKPSPSRESRALSSFFQPLLTRQAFRSLAFHLNYSLACSPSPGLHSSLSFSTG